MKITIDISDFYLDEEEELMPALRKHIIQTVITEIETSIKKKVEDQITREVHLTVESTLLKKISLFIGDFLKVGKIKSTRFSNKELTIEDYIKEKFEYDSGWSSPNSHINDIAKKLGSELKQRYDILFASQIVIKLNEQGMLKEDIAKLLLAEPIKK